LQGTPSTYSGTRLAKNIEIGWTNFSAVAMETKRGIQIFFWIPFIELHKTLQEYPP
jgi:hypothetical protein